MTKKHKLTPHFYHYWCPLWNKKINFAETRDLSLNSE